MAEITLEHIQTKSDVSKAGLPTLLLALIEHIKAANQRLERIEERINNLENAHGHHDR